MILLILLIFGLAGYGVFVGTRPDTGSGWAK